MLRSSRYLWCVNHYSQNNQLKDFIKCALIASIIDFTLVIPPFFPHYLVSNKELQWFDHLYDLQSFSSVVNSIPIDEWIQSTTNLTKRLMIDCYLQLIQKITNALGYGKRIRQKVEGQYWVPIDFHRFINLSSTMKMEELVNKSNDCRSIFLHIENPSLINDFGPPHRFVQQTFTKLRQITEQSLELLPRLANNNQPTNQSNIIAVTHFLLRRSFRDESSFVY